MTKAPRNNPSVSTSLGFSGYVTKLPGDAGGVAAPLEPTPLYKDELKSIVWSELGKIGTGQVFTLPIFNAVVLKVMQLCEFHAAAVSKKLRDELAQANFQHKMWRNLAKEWEELCNKERERITALEQEIAELRKKP